MSLIHRLNSIYPATEGEGVHIGTPQIFVRYQGCKIGCLNCDSRDTWAFRGGNILTTPEVIEQLKEHGFGSRTRRVSITGGDPLDDRNISSALELVQELKKHKAWINIEAAGNVYASEIFSLVDFISFDVKTPSTGVKNSLDPLKKVIESFSHALQIKAVVADKSDFDFISEVKKEVEHVEGADLVQWVLTPVFNYGEDFPKERVAEIIKWNQFHGGFFRVIGQQHKWVYGPDKKYI